MALNFGGMPQLFQHSKEFDQGQGNIRKGAGTFVVALDGSGDFSDIQEAINALPNERGCVYVKEGTYKLLNNATISVGSNVLLLGTGRGTIIQTIWDGVNHQNVINMSGTYPKLEKIWLKGNANNTNAGIIYSVANYSSIKDCWISDNGGAGIEINANNFQIIGNVINNNGREGIFGVGTRCVITNNHIFSNRDGIYIDSFDNSIISSNNIFSNTQDGISITADNASSDNNNILNNNIQSNNRGIAIGSTCTKNIVMGNIVLNNTTSQITDAGTNTHPNGVSGTTNLALDDLNIIA